MTAVILGSNKSEINTHTTDFTEKVATAYLLCEGLIYLVIHLKTYADPLLMM